MEGPLTSLRQSLIQLPAPKTVRLSDMAVSPHKLHAVQLQRQPCGSPGCVTCCLRSQDTAGGACQSLLRLLLILSPSAAEV